MLKIGWFSTARGESSRHLLEACVSNIDSGNLKAQIEFVFCSRELGESHNTNIFINKVIDYHLPLVCLSVKKYAANLGQQVGSSNEELPGWRLAYDREIISRLESFNVDVCVLAGYMLIVSPELCNRYNMINLHPALPDGPKGTWQEVIWTLIENRAIESGAMMHLVTPALDRGPVITYCKYRLDGVEFMPLWHVIDNIAAGKIKDEQGENNELFKAIRNAGFKREIPLIIHTLKAFSESRISIGNDKKLYDHHGRLISGYDLTPEIDAVLASSKF